MGKDIKWAKLQMSKRGELVLFRDRETDKQMVRWTDRQMEGQIVSLLAILSTFTMRSLRFPHYKYW